VSLISILLLTGSVLPGKAHAGLLSDIFGSIKRSVASAEAAQIDAPSIQTMDLGRPANNIDPTPARGGGDIVIVDDNALMPDEGPSGTIADIEKPKNATISVYVVRAGDSIGSVSKLFDVTPDTIRWANDIPKGGNLKVGQVLTILPVPGVKYTIKKGDTLAVVAKRTGADVSDIASYNGLDVADALDMGTTIIIPDGEAPEAPVAKTTKPVTTKTKTIASKSRSTKAIGAEPAHDVGPEGSAAEDAYYIAPIAHYVETQGVHGYNAVDLAAPVGTPIMAAADGDIIVAKAGGWNGGYGSYVVIQHDNGSQTLYGHMSRVVVGDGQHVVQGQIIGYVGSTGKSTGPHCHFEIRNGIRNPF
jgi:LysM repeat protein